MKKHLPTIILLLVFVAGLSLLLYPTVSDYINSFRQTRAISVYKEYVDSIDDIDYEKLLSDARAYNEELAGESLNRFISQEADIKEYNSLLNASGTGLMGYIEIPSIQCELPIYHGTSDIVLAAGVGHIEGSSLPVGGGSTHCILSGHRGRPSSKLFTNLNEMAEGDIFILHILDETLTYEVDRIRIVEPREIEELNIIKGRDYCTLVTCTPYGVNTHRLLVRGHRVENQEESNTVRINADAALIEPTTVAPIIAAPILIALFIALMLKTRKKKR